MNKTISWFQIHFLFFAILFSQYCVCKFFYALFRLFWACNIFLLQILPLPPPPPHKINWSIPNIFSKPCLCDGMTSYHIAKEWWAVAEHIARGIWYTYSWTSIKRSFTKVQSRGWQLNMGSGTHPIHPSLFNWPEPTRKQHYLIIENTNKKYFIQNNINPIVTRVV